MIFIITHLAVVVVVVAAAAAEVVVMAAAAAAVVMAAAAAAVVVMAAAASAVVVGLTQVAYSFVLQRYNIEEHHDVVQPPFITEGFPKLASISHKFQSIISNPPRLHYSAWIYHVFSPLLSRR